VGFNHDLVYYKYTHTTNSHPGPKSYGYFFNFQIPESDTKEPDENSDSDDEYDPVMGGWWKQRSKPGRQDIYQSLL